MPKSSKIKKGGRVTPKAVRLPQIEEPELPPGTEQFGVDTEELRAIDRRKLSMAEEAATSWEAVARTERKQHKETQELLKQAREELDRMIGERTDAASESKAKNGNKKNGKESTADKDKAGKVRKDR